jgi:hypothetical protein
MKKLTKEILDEIEKHPNWVDWRYISACQDLSEAFMEKHKLRLEWNSISHYQKMSEKFMIKNIEFIKTTWLKYNTEIPQCVIQKIITMKNSTNI